MQKLQPLLGYQRAKKEQHRQMKVQQVKQLLVPQARSKMKLRPEAPRWSMQWDLNLAMPSKRLWIKLKEIWTKNYESSLRNIIKHQEAKSTCRISRQTSERSQQT